MSRVMKLVATQHANRAADRQAHREKETASQRAAQASARKHEKALQAEKTRRDHEQAQGQGLGELMERLRTPRPPVRL